MFGKNKYEKELIKFHNIITYGDNRSCELFRKQELFNIIFSLFEKDIR